MEVDTPKQTPAGLFDAQHTREEEPTTPSTFKQTSHKRRKDLNYITPPPPINFGQTGPTQSPRPRSSIAAIIDAQLEEIQKQTKARLTVISDFGKAVDTFIQSRKKPEEQVIAKELSNAILTHITTLLNPATTQMGGAASSQINHKNNNAPAQNKRVTFAQVAATKSSDPFVGPNKNASELKKPETASTSKNLDKRLLVQIASEARLHRTDSFLIRQNLCKRIEGLSLSKLPPLRRRPLAGPYTQRT
ncbi:hypothetical protein OCU04_012653 [Sclerotinia nivalis]|uniref:Uncharacterized protein n=1 Tax=Sclerotinia nivalis TaxID=352851 RepID=A0A9X0A904_9HELO|nr:hypothetical protein OCU04_012653 [Sclerotinia nivalis]